MKAKTLKRKNLKGLKLSNTPRSPISTPSAQDAQVPGGIENDVYKEHDHLSGQLNTLEIGVEFKLDLRAEDLTVLHELGAGNGGTVSKVMHQTLKTVMAKKVCTLLRSMSGRPSLLTQFAKGNPYRRKANCTEADSPRTAHHARMPFTLHCLVLWSILERG